MEPISPKNALALSKIINKFSYFSNPFYLALNCTTENKNNENLVYETEVSDGKQSLLFLPNKKENMINQRIGTVYNEDIAQIKKLNISILEQKQIGIEYFYISNAYESLEGGGEMGSIKKEMRRFRNTYDIKILHDYPIQQVINFMKFWESQKNLSSKSELTKQIFESDLKNCIESFKLMEEIPAKKIFIEIDNKLAGFTIFTKLSNGLGVGLIQKTDYSYKGLSKYFYHLIGKEIDTEIFTTGAEAQDPSLAQFKQSLHPCRIEPIYLMTLGNEKK